LDVRQTRERLSLLQVLQPLTRCSQPPRRAPALTSRRKAGAFLRGNLLEQADTGSGQLCNCLLSQFPTMKSSIAILALLLVPFAANAGEWFVGYRGWGGWGVSSIGGDWTLRLGDLADVPLSPVPLALWLLAFLAVLVIGLLFSTGRKQRGHRAPAAPRH